MASAGSLLVARALDFYAVCLATTTTKGQRMWALVIFTIATTGVASSTVTSIEFATQHLCLVAERQLETLTEPLVSEGLVRYQVVGTCVQVKEEAKKK